MEANMKIANVQIKKILYATDLSENAVHAFSYAVSLATLYGASITILYVLADLPGEEFVSNLVGSDTWRDIKARHYSEAREQLIGKRRGPAVIQEVLQAFSDEAKNKVQDRALVTDDILIESGTPADVIVETAKKQDCDLIVMGTHGMGVIADVLIGSTAKWVVRHSPIPVLVVQQPKKAKPEKTK